MRYDTCRFKSGGWADNKINCWKDPAQIKWEEKRKKFLKQQKNSRKRNRK